MSEIAKAFKGIAPGLHKGSYSTPYEPPAARSQCADTRWVMTYGHKTQSFMKNGGQQNAWIKP